MDFLNVSTYGTSATSTKVLVLDGTTVKSRTAQEILGDGGGTSIPDGDKGDITVSGSGTTWTIDSNAVSYSKIQQSSGLSVIGNSGSSTANVGAITGSVGQVLRVNDAGTALDFGAVNLNTAASITGTLAVANGGTGITEVGIANTFLTSSGTSLSWSKIGLTTGVTGVLPVANGGTGLSSLATGMTGFFANGTSASLRSALTDETGFGKAVFNDGPTLINPTLGTPASGSLDNCAGLPTGGVTFTNTSRILGRKTALGGVGEECTLSEILDFVGSAAQGDILYRGASSWTRLGAGTNGQFLKTQGTGANPVWATVSATTNKRADFTIIDFQGYAPVGGIASSLNEDPFPDSLDYLVYRTEFSPTNFTLGLWCTNASGNNPGNVGFDLEYTVSDPPTSGWTPVSGSTLNINGLSGEFKYVSSTVSVSSFSSAAFWRLRWVNSTGSNASISVKGFYLSLWN
jgi:hypothetical protein